MTEAEPGIHGGTDDVAAAWLLAHDRGLTTAEVPEFQAWLAASPENLEAWVHASRVWAEFDADPDPLLESMRLSARALRGPLWRTAPGQLTALAAAVLLSIGVVGVLHQRPERAGSGSPIAAQVVPTIHETGAKRSEIALADGSHVTLDARSRLSVVLSPGRRDVALIAGQAYFRVAHDASRPFVVTAGGHTVTATGTAFDVSLVRDGLLVILAEGKVAVASVTGAVAPTELVAGQEFQQAGTGIGAVRSVDLDAVLSWREGILDLHDVAIRDAVARMNRYAAHPVIVGDAQAGMLRVSGRFSTDDPLRFAQRLAEIYPLRVESDEDGSATIRSIPPG